MPCSILTISNSTRYICNLHSNLCMWLPLDTPTKLFLRREISVGQDLNGCRHGRRRFQFLKKL